MQRGAHAANNEARPVEELAATLGYIKGRLPRSDCSAKCAAGARAHLNRGPAKAPLGLMSHQNSHSYTYRAGTKLQRVAHTAKTDPGGRNRSGFLLVVFVADNSLEAEVTWWGLPPGTDRTAKCAQGAIAHLK